MADKKVKVQNRTNSVLVYHIPEMGIRREFMPKETKIVTAEEITALSYRPGGTNMIKKNLMVQDMEVLQDLSIHVEQEYFLDEQGVIDLLEKNDNLDAFLDCLDFAPEGVIELIKIQAVKLPVNDSRKRDAIKKRTGFDVDAALRHQQAVKDAMAAENNGDTIEGAPAPTRRVKPVETAPTGRRTTPNYKVVTPKAKEE